MTSEARSSERGSAEPRRRRSSTTNAPAQAPATIAKAPAKAPPRHWSQHVALLMAVCVTLWVGYEAQRHIRVFAVAGKARYQTDKWVSGATAVPSSTALERALGDMNAAVHITPDDASLQEQLGDLHMVAAEYLKDDLALRDTHLKAALAQYQQALQLLPTDPQTWASLAATYHAMGEAGAPMQQAWLKSLALGPNEGHVWPMLLELALANWAQTTPEMQAWVQDFFAKSNTNSQKAINKVAGRYGLQLQLTEPESAETPTPAASAAR